MKKKINKMIAFLLVLASLCSMMMLTGCGQKKVNTDTLPESESESETKDTAKETETASETETETETESETETETETESETVTETEKESEKETEKTSEKDTAKTSEKETAKTSEKTSEKETTTKKNNSKTTEKDTEGKKPEGDASDFSTDSDVNNPNVIAQKNKDGSYTYYNPDYKPTAVCEHIFDHYETDKAGHVKVCAKCGKMYGITENTDHVWVDGEVIQQATTTSIGLQKRKCSVCGYEDTKELSMVVDNDSWKHGIVVHAKTVSGELCGIGIENTGLVEGDQSISYSLTLKNVTTGKSYTFGSARPYAAGYSNGDNYADVPGDFRIEGVTVSGGVSICSSSVFEVTVVATRNGETITNVTQFNGIY